MIFRKIWASCLPPCGDPEVFRKAPLTRSSGFRCRLGCFFLFLQPPPGGQQAAQSHIFPSLLTFCTAKFLSLSCFVFKKRQKKKPALLFKAAELTQSEGWIFSTKGFYDAHLLTARWQSALECVQLHADVELSFFSIFCGKCSEGLNQTSTEEEEEEEEEEAVRGEVR